MQAGNEFRTSLMLTEEKNCLIIDIEMVYYGMSVCLMSSLGCIADKIQQSVQLYSHNLYIIHLLNLL